MPPIEVTCANPECGEKFQVGVDKAGELVECPKCGASVYVLEPDEPLEIAEAGEQVKGKPIAQQAHIAHPARLTCPNCGAVLGVRDAFCPDCGADVRTGAAVMTTVERKKLNLVPIFIGVGILVAVAAFIFLAIFAVKKVHQHAADQAKKTAAALAAAAAPVAQAPGPAAVVKPKLAYEIPKQVLADLADRELAAGQAADAYLDQLRKTLAALAGADHDKAAAQWADLYQYCTDKGLQTEAEQAWYQAVRLGSRDDAVTKKLGLTDAYEGVPVTPAEKQFLVSLKPQLKVINHDPALKDCVVVIKGMDPVPVPSGKVVEIQPPAGPIVLTVARAASPDRSLEEFALSADPGVVQTVELYSPYVAPSMPIGAMGAIYTAVSSNQDSGGVTLKRDTAGKAIIDAGAGDIHVLGSAEAAVQMWLTAKKDQLAIIGRIALGNRFAAQGARLFSGTSLHPLSFAVTDQTSPLQLSAGGYAVLHADMTDGLWGMLGTANGDVSYEFARSRLDKRLDDVAFEDTLMEARGELIGPWQTRVRIYDEITAQNDQLQHALAERQRAAGQPLWVDRVRLLGLTESNDTICMNWPRFRGALAIAMKGAADGVADRLLVIGPASPSLLGGQPAVGSPAAPIMPPMPGVPGMMGTTAVNFTLDLGAPAPDADTASVRPALVPMDSEARTYALMRVLPLLPDDAVLQKVQDMWPQLNGQQRLAALMALEQVATPQAIAWLGDKAKTAADSDETAMLLLSLGAIGTPEALAQTDVPGVSAKVHTASLVAAIVAGKADAIDQVPAFLTTASPDERAAFLQYLTEFDTPSTVLALASAADAYSKEPQSAAKIATALSRIGGRAALRELSRLMDKAGQTYPDRLAGVRNDGAFLLVRQVGTAASEQKTPDKNALQFLVADGSDASVSFLLAAAINQNSAAAMEALGQIGTAHALEAAGQAAKAVTPEMLAALRLKWYSPAPKGGPLTWNAGVDKDGALKLLAKVFAGSASPKARVAAAAMLQEAGQPLPPDQLLAFAGEAAGKPAAGKFSLAGFEWPAGLPLTPEGTQLDGPPGLYAVGLALEAKDASLSAELQKLLAATQSGSLKAAASAALGRLGGDANLTALHDAAAKNKDAYADAAELAKVLQDRLAALAGLAQTQDAAFLPRALDMLKESPPPASALPKGDNAEELADWWQIELWRGACDCVAGICRQRSPLELTADSGLQQMLTDRLKELIAEPGPKRESLAVPFRQDLRAAAIRAFGRVADFSDPDNKLILDRLVVDLTQKAGTAAGPRGMAAMPGRGGPLGQPQPQQTQADPLRVALLDAVAHAGSRVQDVTDFVGYARSLTSSDSLTKAWDDSIRQMADAPTAGYFTLLTAIGRTLDEQTGTAVFDATRNTAEAKSQPYGTFLASLIETTAAPSAQQLASRPAEPAQPAAPTAAQPAAAPSRGTEAGPSPYSAEQMAAFQARGRGMAEAARRSAAAYGARQGAGGMGRGTPENVTGPAREAATGVVPEYDRHLPYKREDWQYKLDETGKQVAKLRQKWAIVQTLIESSGPSLPAVVQAANLLTTSDLGPVAAPAMVKQDASLLDSVAKELGGLLAPGAAEPAPAPGAAPAGKAASPMASQDARRAAVAALRNIGGQPAADALYNGLVGPAVAAQAAAPGMRGMPPGMPPMGMPQMPMSAQRAMESARAASGDPVPVWIADALGSMGRYDLLQTALKANDRKFFQEDAITVQSAALSGMAFLPAADDPLAKLAELVRAANVEAIRKAASDALFTAARLTGTQG